MAYGKGTPKMKSSHTKLTQGQEIFIREVVNGRSHIEAHKIAYPKSKSSDKVRSDIAYRIMSKPAVRERYEQLLQEMREREQEKQIWTRELATENLRFLVEEHRREIVRIQQAYEEELEILAKNLKEHPEQADQIISKMISAKKSTRIDFTSSKGMTAAIAELNKMQGFNEQNVNVNGTVLFEGEDDLQD